MNCKNLITHSFIGVIYHICMGSTNSTVFHLKVTEVTQQEAESQHVQHEGYCEGNHDQELHYELHHECWALNWLRKNSISRLTEKNSISLKLTEKNSSSLCLAQKVLLWLFTESCSAVVVAVAVTVAGTVPVTDAIGAVIVATILLVSSENVWKVFYSYTLCKCKL